MILMASSTGTPAARGLSVGIFRSARVTCGLLYQVMRFSQRAVYTYYFIHIFTETKKILRCCRCCCFSHSARFLGSALRVYARWSGWGQVIYPC